MRNASCAVAGLALCFATFAAPASAQDDDALIASAVKAAPATVSSGATVYAVGADGQMRTLREGTNGWWCLPDDPNTPGEDPMCGDANSLAWAGAWMGKTEPPAGKVGFMYMLMGGPAGSNTDPYMMAPPEGQSWVETGPHVMIVNSKGFFDGYKGGETPDTTVPYIMWEGTPYEHLMIPTQ